MKRITTRRQSFQFCGSIIGALALCWTLVLSPLTTQAQEAPKLKIATNMGDIMATNPDGSPVAIPLAETFYMA